MKYRSGKIGIEVRVDIIFPVHKKQRPCNDRGYDVKGEV